MNPIPFLTIPTTVRIFPRNLNGFEPQAHEVSRRADEVSFDVMLDTACAWSDPSAGTDAIEDEPVVGDWNSIDFMDPRYFGLKRPDVSHVVAIHGKSALSSEREGEEKEGTHEEVPSNPAKPKPSSERKSA